MLLLRLELYRPLPPYGLEGFAEALDAAWRIARRVDCTVRYMYGDAVVTLEWPVAADKLRADYARLHTRSDRYTRSASGAGYTLSFVDGAA
jgi:hypothetical protein